MMQDEDFEKGVKELTDMLHSLQRIKDRGRRRWLKVEIRVLFNRLLKD